MENGNNKGAPLYSAGNCIQYSVINRPGKKHEKIYICIIESGFLLAQMVKNPPAVQETRVRSLGQEDLLEKGMATHSSTLAWRIPWTEEPGGLQPRGSQRAGHD